MSAATQALALRESAAARLLAAANGEPEGLDWEVEIIRPGLSRNGVYYPPDTLRAAAAVFEGVHVYAHDNGAHAAPGQKGHRALAGWIDGVHARDDGTLVGRLHFLGAGVAGEIRAKLLDAWKRGKRDLLGLSIDARGVVSTAVREGRAVRVADSIVRAESVDVVLEPAAGGRFTRLVASAAAITQEEGMEETDEQTRNAEVGMRNGTAGTDEEVQQGPLSQDGRGENSDHDAAEAALREARLLRSEVALERALERSRLPELARRRIAKRLSGEVLGEEEIREAIEDERDYLARLHPARVHGLGQERGGDGQVVVGAGRLDRLQAALDRACGLEIEDPALRAVRPLGLRGLYNEITLGHDPEIRGTLSEAAQAEMLREAFTNATLPRVVANTLHRRMTRDYRAFDYGERRIVSSVGSAGDFRTQEAVRVGYFGDIPAVDPEAADYAELAAYGEESATYTVGQRGAIVTITRKHILNDDIGHVARVVGRLGRAARRTFARFVWDFVVDNPPIYDGVAWFAAGHNNLLAAALDQAGLNAAEQLLFNQTELSSGEKLGLAPQLLVVPIELKPTAWALNASGTSDNDNPWRGRFGANGENILVNPFFADANDWAVFADPREADIVEVKFLNGREEPELFLADSPTVGQMFTADKLQYKIRHEYGGAVVDYRSAVKSVVV